MKTIKKGVRISHKVRVITRVRVRAMVRVIARDRIRVRVRTRVRSSFRKKIPYFWWFKIKKLLKVAYSFSPSFSSDTHQENTS